MLVNKNRCAFVITAAVILLVGVAAWFFFGTREAAAPDVALTVGEATVTSINILLMESFPLQGKAVLVGTLPDACTEISEVTTIRSGNTFRVRAFTQRPADLLCAQVVTPFSETISLDIYGLPAGIYVVTAGGGVSKTFELAADNHL
jgi:hypothetical protein